MRSKFLIFISVLSLSCLADWSDEVIYYLSNIKYTVEQQQIDTNQSRYILNDIKSNTQDTKSNTLSIASNFNSLLGGSGHIGWGDFVNNQYLKLNELSDAKEYRWAQSLEGSIYGLEEVDPFSDKNKTFFSQDDEAQDNSLYYQNNIMSYFKPNYSVQYPNSVPDSSFLEYPQYGDLFTKIANEMSDEGLDVSAIENSAQTAQIRQEVASAETKIKGMITNDYSNSTINYDFSEIGNYFVRAGVMNSNPFYQLRGTFRIKPNVDDLHYGIWHNYFDRDNSVYAVALNYCLHTIMFLWFTIYVINDVMAIVNA